MASSSEVDAAASAAPAPKASLDMHKQSFREYLWKTQVVSTREELDALMALLHTPLPVAFRLNLHHPDSQRVMQRLQTDLQFEGGQFFHEGTTINPPSAIAWYPLANVAWQVDCGRVALSKGAPKHEPVKRFHACLLDATDRGLVDRQEAVSMLPVLYLDVQRGHSVLDMCASPGSKTTQVLDFLGGEGMVVANDLDRKRAYMLVHRLSRHTLRNAVVTCGSGATFAGLYDPETKILRRTNAFDRVLCDVPCSGDGTLRKNQALWIDWHIGHGLTIHETQLALATRGAALVKVGGLMVYSTCSFNPVENEAVVAELLRRSDGALEVEDVSGKLPSLVTRAGRKSWLVGWRSKSKSALKGRKFANANADAVDDEIVEADADAEDQTLHDWYDSYSALPEDLRGYRILRSMFPPATSDPSIAEQLSKTMRLVPIDQNSGGFFVAVLRKTRDLPGMDQQGLPALEEQIELTPPEGYLCRLCQQSGHFMKNCAQFVPASQLSDEQHPRKKPRKENERPKIATKANGGKLKPRNEPIEALYRRISDDLWAHLQSYYGIADDAMRAKLWCRSDMGANVCYVDEAIADACLAGDALDIVNMGLRVFVKQNDHGKPFYRAAEEALGFIETFFTKRVLDLDRADFNQLLERADKHVMFTALAETAQTAIATMEAGPAIARLAADPSLAINVWIGPSAILPRVSKTKRTQIREALQVENDQQQ